MATMATAPIGMLTRNSQRQPSSSPATAMIAPPRIGPMAEEIDTVRPKRPNARPRSGPWKSSWINPELWGVSSPADAPCSSRAATTSSALGAIPTAALATTKPVSPTSMRRRRPKASPIRPPATRVSPKASA